MKNILQGDSSLTSVVNKVENAEDFFAEPLTEEVVLYDECGDTQWDKVLMQHDFANEISKDINDITK